MQGENTLVLGKLNDFFQSCINTLYSIKYILPGGKVGFPITIQWHITSKCSNNCKHCYMYDTEAYKREQERTLTLTQKLEIVDQIDAFGKKYGFWFNHYVLIGGDPLLADDVFGLLKGLKRRGKTTAFAGNPETLTDENCRKLKKYGITSFQLSLDGLKDTHDSIRGQGSFERTIAGYEKLERYKIHSTTMVTLSGLNVHEFFDTVDFVYYKTKSKGLTFDFCVRIGNARNIDTDITPEQAMDISKRFIEIKNKREKERPDFYFGEKPGFFRLLRMQRKDIAFLDSEATNFTAGCLIGSRCQCILSDGTLLLCRRLPKIIGRLPEDRFEEIFLSNETLKKYRRPQFFTDCGNCKGWNLCRGCPGSSDAESGNPFKKPNTCFAHLLDMDTHCMHKPVPMGTTLVEEADLIKNNSRQEYHIMQMEQKFPFRLLKIFHKLEKQNEAKVFIENPKEWFLNNALKLNPDDQNIIVFHYNRKAFGLDKRHRGPRWPT